MTTPEEYPTPMSDRPDCACISPSGDNPQGHTRKCPRRAWLETRISRCDCCEGPLGVGFTGDDGESWVCGDCMVALTGGAANPATVTS